MRVTLGQLFASMYTAYEALPRRLHRRVEGLKGRSPTAAAGRRRRCSTKRTATGNPSSIRSFARIPRPGARVEGLDERESDALIDELTGYMIQPDARYRHRWRKGDVVIWDNRCSYHKAAGDYPSEKDRIHWRVSIKEHPGVARLTGE